MVVIKLSDAIKGRRVKVDGPKCGGLYKEDNESIITWSGTDPGAKMNSFTWSTEENDWIFLGNQYNEEFNNQKGHINNVQFYQQNLKWMRKTEETCSKYAGPVKFNGIPREGNQEIPIKYCKDQCREHMTNNGMWDVLSLPDPCNKEKRWDIILHQYRFPLDYVKIQVQSLLKGFEADQYIVQNLAWSGVYLRSTLSNNLLWKVLTLVPLTATGAEVFVASMTTFLSDSYDTL